MAKSSLVDIMASLRELREGGKSSHSSHGRSQGRNVHFCIPPVARNSISRRTSVRSDHPRKRASSVTG